MWVQIGCFLKNVLSVLAWMVFTQLNVVGKQSVVYAFKNKFNVKGLFLKSQLLLVLVVVRKSSYSWLLLKYRNLGIQDSAMNLTVEIEQEEDGRWIAEVVDLPGVLVYAQTLEDATTQVQALALRVLADRLEHGESGSALVNVSFQAA
jgi:predicted RNase H-like HicB family nuclease